MSKLLLVSGEYPPTVGGVSHYSYRLVSGLAQLGWEVKVATLNREPGVRLPDYVVGVGSTWGWGAYFRTLRLAGHHGSRVVSLQYQTGCYGMHPSVNLLPLTLKRVGRLAVTTFHDLLAPYLFPKAGRLRWLANQLTVAASHRIVLVDPSDLAKIPERHRVRVRLVPIGPNILPPEKVDIRSRRNSFGYRLIYFGLANRSKGLDLAIEAAAQLRDMQPNLPWHLRIIGGGVGTDPRNVEFRNYCLELIAALKLEERVTFLGELDEEGVRRELLRADMAILPYRDGVSYRRGSLVVCLSFGLPVVTCGPLPDTVAPGWPIFQHGYNLSVCTKGDPQCLAQHIAHLADDPALRFSMVQAALETSQFFRWEAVCSQMSSVLMDVEETV